MELLVPHLSGGSPGSAAGFTPEPILRSSQRRW
jgi:hypothetical protein